MSTARPAETVKATATTGWAHRLWLRIWLAAIAGIVLVAVVAVVIWRTLFDPTQIGSGTVAIASGIAAEMPGSGAAPAQLQQALERARARTEADLALFDERGAVLARAGRPVPPPRLDEDDSHWVGWHARMGEGRGPGDRFRSPAYALKLADDRWLVVRRPVRSMHRPVGPWPTLALLALAVAAGTYPIVRRLTRRLERLQQSVERLGGGDLTARVPVEGRDEVARLAVSFNDAAARIEQLVQAHRRLLANASHELRSPLARVRMAVELMQTGNRPEIAQEVARDIAELDALIDEILLMSRLETLTPDASVLRERFETLDFTAVVAEECGRANVQFSGERVELRGDVRLLRRVVRNLLDNARRHGGGAPIEVTLVRGEGGAIVSVSDRGPGVPEAERERIFEPFYRAQGVSETDGGVGLGLALVRSIVHQHGGRVVCLGREGGGSVFRVTLPLERTG
jgi:signal transduction histidine kinase